MSSTNFLITRPCQKYILIIIAKHVQMKTCQNCQGTYHLVTDIKHCPIYTHVACPMKKPTFTRVLKNRDVE